MSDTAQALVRLFQGDAANQAVYFVTQAQQVFSQIATILAGYARNQCFLQRFRVPSRASLPQ